MRQFDTKVQFIKYKVLKEVAIDAWEDKLPASIPDIPERVIPGKVPSTRCCVYKERAIVAQRVKMALGGTRSNKNIIEVIPLACDECPTDGYEVTNTCRGCLAHNCKNACKFDAIYFDEVNHQAHINKDKCKECGACAKACLFTAIQKRTRPCQNACKIKAISMNEDRTCKIDNDKCISCGACAYQCPFGAIMDKSFILNIIDIIKRSEGNTKYKVHAVIAPAIASQFPEAKLSQVVTALHILGFAEVFEAALAADVVAHHETEELVEKGFLTSSCCPAFVKFIDINFPNMKDKVSHNKSPMITMGRILKEKDPNCKVIFIGPCTAKKMEFKREDVKGAIDSVMTFEEVLALFDSRGIVLNELKETPITQGSYFGRIFAKSGGLAEAVVEGLKETGNEEFKYNPIVCSGIEECNVALLKANRNMLPNNFVEGMACIGGCVNGAGNINHGEKNKVMVDEYSKLTENKKIVDYIETLK